MTARAVTLLSEIEQLVLLAVLKLSDHAREEAYAVPIRALIRTETGIDVPRGSIYVTLQRLESQGLIGSAMTDPVAVQGGKARRAFSLRPSGMAALRSSTRAMNKMIAGTVFAKN